MREIISPMIRVFFAGGMMICAAMIVVWLIRYKKQGTRSLVMSAAFLMLGGLFWATLNEKPTGYMIGFGIFLFLFLAIDIVLRSIQRAKQETP